MQTADHPKKMLKWKTESVASDRLAFIPFLVLVTFASHITVQVFFILSPLGQADSISICQPFGMVFVRSLTQW